MYTSTNNHSSKKNLHHINQTAYSFSDQFKHIPTPYEVNKKLSQQITSSPLSHHGPARIFEQDTFNSGWSNELSKIDQLNSKISRTTEEILHSKHRSRASEHEHHSSKQPQQKNRKYLRQYVRFQPTLTKHNYGHEPVIMRRESKDNDSESHKSRKNSIKINILYGDSPSRKLMHESSPSRKGSFQSGIDQGQRPERDSLKSPYSSVFQSPSSNYHKVQLNGYRSTELILANNRSIMQSNSMKKDAKFIYQTTHDQSDQNPNKRSTLSAYEMAKYSPKGSQNPLRNTQKDGFFKMTKSSYLEDHFGGRNSHDTDKMKEKEKEKEKPKKAFYEMEEFEMGTGNNTWRTKQTPEEARDMYYDMDSPENKKISTRELPKLSNPEPKLTTLDFKEPPQTEKASQFSAGNSLSQMKDKQSRLIAIVLIILALVIFIMQLFS